MKIVIKFEMSVANVNTNSSLPKRLESDKQFDSIYKNFKPLIGFAIMYCLKIIVSYMFGN